MKIVEKNDNSLLVEITEKEFNLIRELESAVLISCKKEEIQTLTGWTREELLDFGNTLSKLARENNINL